MTDYFNINCIYPQLRNCPIRRAPYKVWRIVGILYYACWPPDCKPRPCNCWSRCTSICLHGSFFFRPHKYWVLRSPPVVFLSHSASFGASDWFGLLLVLVRLRCVFGLQYRRKMCSWCRRFLLFCAAACPFFSPRLLCLFASFSSYHMVLFPCLVLLWLLFSYFPIFAAFVLLFRFWRTAERCRRSWFSWTAPMKRYAHYSNRSCNFN